MAFWTQPQASVASILPDSFEGGALGVIGAVVVTVICVLGAIVADRRLDGALQQWAQARGGWRRYVTDHAAMMRVGIWTITLVFCLSIAAYLSPPVAWMLLPASGLALALAVSDLMRDALVGIGQAMGARVKRGDQVSVGNVAGRVVRVGIRSIQLQRLDGTLVDIPQRRIAAEGVQRLQMEDGGHPVTLQLPIPDDVSIQDAMEEARLAALLARHAHLGKGAVVAMTADTPVQLQVTAQAIDAFHGSQYRGEVVTLYHAALQSVRDKHST